MTLKVISSVVEGFSNVPKESSNVVEKQANWKIEQICESLLEPFQVLIKYS